MVTSFQKTPFFCCSHNNPFFCIALSRHQHIFPQKTLCFCFKTLLFVCINIGLWYSSLCVLCANVLFHISLFIGIWSNLPSGDNQLCYGLSAITPTYRPISIVSAFPSALARIRFGRVNSLFVKEQHRTLHNRAQSVYGMLITVYDLNRSRTYNYS